MIKVRDYVFLIKLMLSVKSDELYFQQRNYLPTIFYRRNFMSTFFLLIRYHETWCHYKYLHKAAFSNNFIAFTKTKTFDSYLYGVAQLATIIYWKSWSSRHEHQKTTEGISIDLSASHWVLDKNGISSNQSTPVWRCIL